MATPEQEREAKERLDTALESVAATDPEALIRSEELGSSFDFRDGVPYFRRVIDLFSELRSVSLDFASHTELTRLADVASQANSLFNQVQTFDPNQQNPAQVRDQLVAQVRDAYDGYYDVVAPAVAFATRKGTDFASLERQARRALEGIEQVQTDIAEQQESLRSEAESILDAMRTAAAESGVAQTSIAFEQEADRQQAGGRKWIVATVSLAILTAVFAVLALLYWLLWAPEDLSTAEAIQIGLAKLLAFSVLYFGLVWSGRNFLAHQHNATVNTHRQNALRTFEAFVKASSDESTKNAVLLQATQSIFAPQPTGYLTGDAGQSQPMPQILEILRSTTSSGPTSGA